MAEDILRKNMGKIMFTVIGVLCASIGEPLDGRDLSVRPQSQCLALNVWTGAGAL